MDGCCSVIDWRHVQGEHHHSHMYRIITACGYITVVNIICSNSNSNSNNSIQVKKKTLQEQTDISHINAFFVY